jgi:hypothetical protein
MGGEALATDIKSVKIVSGLAELEFKERSFKERYDILRLHGSSPQIDKACELIAGMDLLKCDFERSEGERPDEVKRIFKEAKEKRYAANPLYLSSIPNFSDQDPCPRFGDKPHKFVTPVTTKEQESFNILNRVRCQSCPSHIKNECMNDTLIKALRERNYV